MRTIYIERQKEILRVVIKENNNMKEVFFEEESGRPVPGEIYKGVVKNIVPAINSVFIDIGVSKNAYMHLDKKHGSRKIKCGDDIIVEVLKDEVGDKGAKVTGNFNIPGTYCVLNTRKGRLNFSKRIEDKAFIRNIKDNIVMPNDVGITIRSNAENAALEEINSEIEKLHEVYENILREAGYSIKPKRLYSDEGILGRILRDTKNDVETKIIANDKEDYTFICQWFKNNINSNIEIKLYDENRMMFDYYGIENDILSLRNRVVELQCGGYIVIDKTEAMYVVDVNSGSNTVNKSIKETAQVTNMEAAEEIARQIRLRNLSGIILIDFINIKDDYAKEKILKVLRNGFIGDKNQREIFSFTQLNLVQITRRRRGSSIYGYLEENYSGAFKNCTRIKLSYINNLIRNEIYRIDKEQDVLNIYMELDQIYKNDILTNIEVFIKDIHALDKKVYINFLHSIEKIKVEPIIFESDLKNIESFKIYG